MIERTLGMAGGLLLLLAAGAAGETGKVALPLASRGVEPHAYGTATQTITTISAWSFSLGTTDATGIDVIDLPHVSPSLGRFNTNYAFDVHFYATLDLPAGAVIDYIGVNSTTDVDSVMGVALWQRDRFGSKSMLAGFSLPAHAWDTDYAGPLGILVDSHVNRQYVLDVEQASSPGYEFWAWVEVWWHRSVSSPPPTPTFGDVPATDLGYSYIEALAASGITGGCGGGNYCPDSNLTRRQMAIFLAKALGLHWPY